MSAISSAGTGGRGDDIAITCNGEERLIAPSLSVAAFIVDLGLNPDLMAVELDGRVLPRQDYQKTVLVAGSRLELLRFVGGG